MTPEEAYNEIMKLKELLWIRHGCSFNALYGDDGEMQCSSCGLDFKRMTAKELENAWVQSNQKKFALTVNLNDPRRSPSSSDVGDDNHL